MYKFDDTLNLSSINVHICRSKRKRLDIDIKTELIQIIIDHIFG